MWDSSFEKIRFLILADSLSEENEENLKKVGGNYFLLEIFVDDVVISDYGDSLISR